MIKFNVDKENHHLEIFHQNDAPILKTQIFADILLIILGMIMLSGFKYVNDITSIIEFLMTVFVFSILFSLKVFADMRYQTPIIKTNIGTLLTTSIARYIGFIPIPYLMFTSSKEPYPILLGMILVSNVFNLLMHLNMSKSHFYSINTKLINKSIFIDTQSKLMGFTGKWMNKIENKTFRYRVTRTKMRLSGFNSIISYSTETFSDLLNNYQHVEEKNVYYSIHIIDTEKEGNNIVFNKDDIIYLIGECRNLRDIIDLTSEMKKLSSVEYCLFLNRATI